MRAIGLGGCTAVVLALLAGVFPASAAALRWSKPAALYQQGGGTSVSCGSSSLCLAAGSSGLMISTDPASGALSWQPVVSQQASCPPPTGPTPGGYFCSPPKGSIASFSPAAVSCPSTTLCVVVGNDEQSGSNEAFFSTDPAGGQATWKPSPLPGNDGMQSVSCSRVGVCVSITSRSTVLATNNVQSSSWQSTDIYPYQPSFTTNGAVDCVIGLCAIASGGGHATAVTSTDPAGGVGFWSGDDIEDFDDLMVIACASKRLCIAADDFGVVFSTRSPANSSAQWRAAPGTYPRSNPFAPGFSAAVTASCSPQGFCAIGKNGVVLTSSKPLSGHWRRQQIDNQRFAISCTSATLCVALDQRGRVITGTA